MGSSYENARLGWVGLGGREGGYFRPSLDKAKSHLNRRTNQRRGEWGGGGGINIRHDHHERRHESATSTIATALAADSDTHSDK